MIIHGVRSFKICTRMAHDHIDFNKIYMIMISITVYVPNLSGIGKGIIDKIARHQVTFGLVSHVTYTDCYIHTCQHMNM